MMGKQEDSAKDKQIISDLKDVHKKVLEDPDKTYNPDSEAPKSEELAEQIKGSDADTDKNAENTEEEKQSQLKGSDGDKDKS